MDETVQNNQNTPIVEPVTPAPVEIPAPPTKPADGLNILYEQAYKEANARAINAERLLAEAQSKLTQTEAPKVNNDEYWNDPATFIRREISSALKETIKPFQRNLEIDSRQRAYQEVKNTLRASIPYFNQIESEVDAIMSSSNMEATPQNIQLAISIAIGARTLKGNPININTVQPQTIPSNPTQVIPPNIPPSNPPAPVPHPVNQSQPLTEIERRIMREQGFKSEEEFIYYRDMPSQITSVPGYTEKESK